MFALFLFSCVVGCGIITDRKKDRENRWELKVTNKKSGAERAGNNFRGVRSSKKAIEIQKELEE